MLQTVPTRDDIIALITRLNAAQLALWYDIGKTIAARPIADAAPAPDFLQATAEELAAEDALWDAAIQSNPARLARMADHALEAHRNGQTTAIDDTGDELRPIHEVAP
jgi:hypothetical protein